MDFILFKRSIKKTGIFTTIFSISLAVIGLIILFAVNADTNHYKIPFSILLIMNGLFIPFIIWMFHISRAFISFGYLIVTYHYEDKSITKFKVNNWLHLFIFLFLVIIFFIELTVTMEAYNNDWIESAKHNWWIIFILFFVNLSLFEFSFYFNNYQFNNDQILKNNIKIKKEA